MGMLSSIIHLAKPQITSFSYSNHQRIEEIKEGDKVIFIGEIGPYVKCSESLNLRKKHQYIVKRIKNYTLYTMYELEGLRGEYNSTWFKKAA